MGSDLGTCGVMGVWFRAYGFRVYGFRCVCVCECMGLGFRLLPQMPISGDLEIYERFCMSHLCRLYAGVMSRGGHVTYVKESCHICEGVMSHM